MKLSGKRLFIATSNLLNRAMTNHWRKRQVVAINDKRRKKISSTVDLSDTEKQEIDEYYLHNYGKKIPYDWHRHYKAFTGNFDVKYFPELLYIPEFEQYMNLFRSYGEVLEDKNFLPIIAKGLGVSIPETVVSSTKGMIKDNNQTVISTQDVVTIINNAGELFCKPSVDSSSGEGCRIISIENYTDLITNESVDSILKSLGNDYIIQRVIKNSESIKRIYSGSINTFRIITYRWENDIKHIPAIMRIGRNGNYLDNAHAGGIFIAINDDGTLHDKAFTEFKESFDCHPDSETVFSGYQIENFDRVIDAAYRIHRAIPQLGVINWDFTIDEKEHPILIEANVFGGSVWLSEKAHGCGPFGENTEKVLRWISFMEKVPKSERFKYAFGKTDASC